MPTFHHKNSSKPPLRAGRRISLELPCRTKYRGLQQNREEPRMMRKAVFLIAACLTAVTVEGAPPATTRVAATPIPEATAIRVDGELNDAVWQTVPPITAFQQREPREGAAPTFQTEARVAYDATALYIAVQAFDPDPKRIVGIRTRRDEDSPSDWVSVLVDSFHDRRSAFEFAVNPAGVKQDSYWFNDTNNDQGWDAVWDVAVSRGEHGWRAEFRIPFSQLRYRPAEASTFGLAIVRKVGRLNETATWPLLAEERERVRLVLRRTDRPAVSIDPRSASRLCRTSSARSRRSRPSPATRWRMRRILTARSASTSSTQSSPGLTLTGTVNPDFGQVEADPAVVNLSAFETFFSERRPFFVEGGGIFSFDIDCNDGNCSGLFYSRRIGRTPRGSADVAGRRRIRRRRRRRRSSARRS